MEMNDKNPISAKDNIPRDLGFEASALTTRTDDLVVEEGEMAVFA